MAECRLNFSVWTSFLSLALGIRLLPVGPRDMVIDFKKTPHTAYPTIIKGAAVEMVDLYKYLWTIIDENLTHDLNNDFVFYSSFV